MLNAPLSFQPLELDFQTPNLDNPARIHVTLPLPQPLDDNINSIRTPPLLKPILSALSPQTMTGDKTIAPEINIANNWHIIPTSGDLLANDTNDLAHFLSLHPFGSWPPKAPPRSNLQVTSFLMTFLVTLTGCGLISSITFLVSVAVLNPTGCESTSNAMPRAWLLFHVFAGFVHVLFFHDLYPLLEMFSTRCLWTTLDLPLAYLSSTNQAQHQKELARHLVPVNSLDCVGEKIFLTMRFDSGYTL